MTGSIHAQIYIVREVQARGNLIQDAAVGIGVVEDSLLARGASLHVWVRLDDVDFIRTCIVLLSNAGSKIAVIMKGNDVNNLRIEVSKNYLVNNLVHKENRSGVAVFKLSKSVFNFSGVILDNTLDFSKSEVSDLEGINVFEYCADQSPNLEVASASSVASNAESLISLFEFCQLNPRDIKDNQFVEE